MNVHLFLSMVIFLGKHKTLEYWAVYNCHKPVYMIHLHANTNTHCRIFIKCMELILREATIKDFKIFLLFSRQFWIIWSHKKKFVILCSCNLLENRKTAELSIRIKLGINSMHNVQYPAMANYIVFYIVINLHENKGL